MLTGTVSQNLKTRTIIKTNLIQTNLKDNDVIIGRSYDFGKIQKISFRKGPTYGEQILAAGLARNI